MTKTTKIHFFWLIMLSMNFQCITLKPVTYMQNLTMLDLIMAIFTSAFCNKFVNGRISYYSILISMNLKREKTSVSLLLKIFLRSQSAESLVIVCFYIIILMCDVAIIITYFCIKKMFFKNKRKIKKTMFWCLFFISSFAFNYRKLKQKNKSILYIYINLPFKISWKMNGHFTFSRNN